MRKVVALTAIAGVALASSEFDGAADNNLAVGLIDLQRIQRHPLYLDSDISGAEPLEVTRQRELIRARFPTLSKLTEDDEMFTVPAEMESKDRRSTFSIFDKKQGEKSEKTEKEHDHELRVLLDLVRTQPKDVQRAIFEAYPIFTTNTRAQSKANDEEEPKKDQRRTNYTVFGKREAAQEPVEEPKKEFVNHGRSSYSNFVKKEAVHKVRNELGSLFNKWLEKELLQNDDELYGIKNIMKKDKDSWKGGVLSLDDEDNELFNLSELINESHKTTIRQPFLFTSVPKPSVPNPMPVPVSTPKRDYRNILNDASQAIHEIKEKNNKNPGLRPISLFKTS